MHKNNQKCTFRDGKESNRSYHILVSMSYKIVMVADQQIERMILYMSYGYGDGGLIALQNNWAL